jgi:hypothetical protein
LPMILAIRMITRLTGCTATLVNHRLRRHCPAPTLGVVDSLCLGSDFAK